MYFPLRILGLSLLLFALARPQSKTSWQDVRTEGIDIMIALDISASMLAKDLKPDRLKSSKNVALEFINDRPNDRIGLVVYEGESFTQCPLTTDHRVLRELFSRVRTGQIEGGTAIGMGLATAINRLRSSEAKSKVVILLTDGVNNRGSIPPLTAAEIAREYGVRVYTIGVGSRGKALSPVSIYPDGTYKYERVEVKIDEETLQQIADMTGGMYYRATDARKLRDIYKEIDQLEKTLIQVTEHSKRNEEFFPFALAGCSLIFLGFFVDQTIFRSVP
jgi:Ca-activated chloride channel family protein